MPDHHWARSTLPHHQDLCRRRRCCSLENKFQRSSKTPDRLDIQYQDRAYQIFPMIDQHLRSWRRTLEHRRRRFVLPGKSLLTPVWWFVPILDHFCCSSRHRCQCRSSRFFHPDTCPQLVCADLRTHLNICQIERKRLLRQSKQCHLQEPIFSAWR